MGHYPKVGRRGAEQVTRGSSKRALGDEHNFQCKYFMMHWWFWEAS